MKTSILILTFLALFISCINAQNRSLWVSVYSSNGDVSFSMPSQPTIVDTLDVNYYTLKTDYAELQTINILFDNAIEHDTVYNNFARFLIYFTGAELLNFNSISNNGILGKEIEATYYNADSTALLHDFYQLYINNNRLLIFTATGSETTLTELQSEKSQFFNSIYFEGY